MSVLRWAVTALIVGSLLLWPNVGMGQDGGESMLCAPPLPPPVAAAKSPDAATSQVRAGLPFVAFLPEVRKAYLRRPPAAPSQALLELQARLEAMVANRDVAGRFAIAVEDLQTGERIGVNGDRPQLAGCVMNFFVLLAALRDVEAGIYPLEAVDGLVRQTIWASDATAARSLYVRVGGGDAVEGVRRVDALHRMVIGLVVTSIDHPPAYPGESLGKHSDNWTTAREMSEVMGLLYRGELLGPALTAYLIEAMTHVKPGLNYLTAALPAAATVSHKNGFFPNWDGYVDNDTAIVRFGPELQYAYAITFLSEAVPTLYADIWLGQALVRETWEYFASTYR